MKTRTVSRLLSRRECAALLGIHPGGWDRLWPQHRELRESVRVIRITPGGRGARRWPESALAAFVEGACR